MQGPAAHDNIYAMKKEITIKELNTESFIEEKVDMIRNAVGQGTAINALSGGVDSSVVTMLGHKALGKNLRTVFIENGLMRSGEPERVKMLFRDLGVDVEVIDARGEFLSALEGITDPEEKREAVTQTFYKEVFGRIVRESGAKHLLQGTILTDVDETVAGIKRQHNVFEQLGIDPQEAFGYQILEPLIQLRKDGVRKVGKASGLPSELFERIPFPGPALAARIIDRTIRPLFPKGFRHETQVMVTVLSAEPEVDPEVLALCGAGLALTISSIPWNGPAASVINPLSSITLIRSSPCFSPRSKSLGSWAGVTFRAPVPKEVST